MLVDREWTDRDNRRLARRIKEAKLAIDASLEDLVCDRCRGLDKAVVRQLATCAWVRAKQNVIVVGATGVGKLFVGAALAQAACRQVFRALSVRVPRLVQDLALARADGTYRSELLRFARYDVLVLDDLLIGSMKDAERRDLLEVLEDRYDRSSTVITCAAANQGVARDARRSRDRRCHLRPPNARCPSPCTARSVDAEEEGNRLRDHLKRST